MANTQQTETNKQLSLLQQKLRELFQLDKGDLEFGLYLIMKMKSAEVEDFLQKDLPKTAQKALESIASEQKSNIEKEIEETIQAAKKMGMNDEEIDKNEKVKKLRDNMKSARADEATEAHLYNHLHEFFSRYYDAGDFMSQRRIRGDGNSSYVFPYNGEEVKMYWANSDQYYIKTAENYSSYIFTDPKWNNARVRFEVVAADAEKDNVKAIAGQDRYFILTTKKEHPQYTLDGENLIIYFDHRPLTEAEKAAVKSRSRKERPQDKLNFNSAKSILKGVADLDMSWGKKLSHIPDTINFPERTILDKHLSVYSAKNEFDYFIHKDLAGFLRRELDFYLKGEILELNDFAPHVSDSDRRILRNLTLMNGVRLIASQIIDFLGSLEEFQRRLWLKKKFVLDTHYCITLNLIPTEFYEEIASNDKQIREWQDFYDFDIKKANGLSNNPEENPYLIVDTRHFDQEFIDRLLTTITNKDNSKPLDEQLDGVLIHGENFQALNLIQSRYHGQVQCIYSDPPYNTDALPIIYKNGYKHSSWLSMIQNNILNLKNLLSRSGGIVLTIDDEELYRVKMLFDENSGLFDYIGTVAVETNPGGRDTNSYFATSHDYAVFWANHGGDFELHGLPREDNGNTNNEENTGSFQRSGGTSTPEERDNSEFAIYVDSGEIVGIGGKRMYRHPEDYVPSSVIFIDHQAGSYDEISVTEFEKKFKSAETIMPVDKNDNKRVWRWSKRERIAKNVLNRKIYAKQKENGYTIKLTTKKSTYKRPKTVWNDPQYSGAANGTMLLNHIIGQRNSFSYPKSLYALTDALLCVIGAEDDSAIVLDYFSGSGTTGHAIMNLNREDEGERKYILVEMGHHFEGALVPRLKKIAFSNNWKDGKPVNRDGQSQFFKIIRIESYEDTLDSLDISNTSSNPELFNSDSALSGGDKLRYQLVHLENEANAKMLPAYFSSPDGHELSIVREGARQSLKADLPETFNYLIGLEVYQRQVIEGVLIITGIDAEGNRCLIIWRNTEKMDDEALFRWFREQGQTVRNQFNANLVYVNGDHQLGRSVPNDNSWQIKTLDLVFHDKMFQEE